MSATAAVGGTPFETPPKAGGSSGRTDYHLAKETQNSQLKRCRTCATDYLPCAGALRQLAADPCQVALERVTGRRVVRKQLQRPGIVGNSAVQIARRLAGAGTVVVRIGVVGVQGDGRAEIADGTLQITQRLARIPAVEIGGGALWGNANRLSGVGHCAIHIAPGASCA